METHTTFVVCQKLIFFGAVWCGEHERRKYPSQVHFGSCGDQIKELDRWNDPIPLFDLLVRLTTSVVEHWPNIVWFRQVKTHSANKSRLRCVLSQSYFF